jgi:hypothetical protein
MLTSTQHRAGIGFAPNGLRAIDAIEPRFRPRYEDICVGNKREDAKHVFFEGMLLEEGLGLFHTSMEVMGDFVVD